jgi:hypothetical protein
VRLDVGLRLLGPAEQSGNRGARVGTGRGSQQ